MTIPAHLLSIVTFLPAVGILVILFLGQERKEAIRITALAVTTLTFAVSVPLFFAFDKVATGFQFVEKADWIPRFGISYHVGIDGISLLLLLLTTLLTPLCVLCSWRAIEKRVKEYMILFLALEIGMSGVFVSLDLFLFYVFWEVMLIPMYFLIGVWGGPRRIYAAVKFFLYTLLGSVLMLVAILTLQAKTGSFDLLGMYGLQLAPGLEKWLFAAFFLAFAIKVPMFPFHTWLPDAHVEAPTAGSVVLAGILLKMGTYGFLRFNLPLFPKASAAAAPFVATLAIIGIIYGALVSMMQKDIKKLVAYSSVSHLGFCMLGIFAFNLQAMEGAVLQMINHGFSTGALFLVVGILYERRHKREIADYGGIAKIIPCFSAVLMIVSLSSLGLPGLNGFVGEFLVLLGTFKADPLWAILAATGVILAAAYLLWMLERVLFGVLRHEENRELTDMNRREWITMLPVLFFIVLIGVFPMPFLSRMEATLVQLLHVVGK
jgi:NADH-quinone oxidoreductase subunit M